MIKKKNPLFWPIAQIVRNNFASIWPSKREK